MNKNDYSLYENPDIKKFKKHLLKKLKLLQRKKKIKKILNIEK